MPMEHLTAQDPAVVELMMQLFLPWPWDKLG
jgi:hypothetical protein